MPCFYNLSQFTRKWWGKCSPKSYGTFKAQVWENGTSPTKTEVNQEGNITKLQLPFLENIKKRGFSEAHTNVLHERLNICQPVQRRSRNVQRNFNNKFAGKGNISLSDKIAPPSVLAVTTPGKVSFPKLQLSQAILAWWQEKNFKSKHNAEVSHKQDWTALKTN